MCQFCIEISFENCVGPNAISDFGWHTTVIEAREPTGGFPNTSKFVAIIIPALRPRIEPSLMKRNPRRLILPQILTLVLFSLDPWECCADDFQDHVKPFTKKYCAECHGKKKANGDLDFSRYCESQEVVRDFRHWSNVIEFIRDGEMPPPEEKNQPTLDERERVVAALTALLSAAAKKYAGDPGVILPRRLSNTEYDLSIRDLTGVNVQATFRLSGRSSGRRGVRQYGRSTRHVAEPVEEVSKRSRTSFPSSGVENGWRHIRTVPGHVVQRAEETDGTGHYRFLQQPRRANRRLLRSCLAISISR